MAPAPPITWQSQTSGVTVRLRGVSAVSAQVAWASGANGTVLRTIDGGQTWQRIAVPGAEALDFRDVDAVSDRVAYILSIGNGPSSRIYKTTDAGAHWNLQFENTDPKAFFDAMTFRDETHGFAFSDSVDGQLLILMTDNGAGAEGTVGIPFGGGLRSGRRAFVHRGWSVRRRLVGRRWTHVGAD